MARQEISQRFAGQRVVQFISAGCLVVGPLPYRQSCLRSAPAMAAEIGCALQVFGGCPHTRPQAVVQSSQSGQAAKQRCLTRRSSGRTTALRSGRQALGLRPSLRLPSSPQCRCAPLSSNVRPRRRDLLISKMQLLGFAAASASVTSASCEAPVTCVAAGRLAIRHCFIFGHLQRAKAACGTVRCAWRAAATFIASATNRAGVA